MQVILVGSVEAGFERVAHLWPAWLAGGDAAARHPVQAAAGYLDQIDGLIDPMRAPFSFPDRYRHALTVVRSGVRSFQTTSTGRLFDTVAALLGFTRAIGFEGQAAMWVEQLARGATLTLDLPVPRLEGQEIDWREMLEAIVRARVDGAAGAAIARAFHRAFAQALADAVQVLAARHRVDAAAFAGGGMQNALLADDLSRSLRSSRLHVWVNHSVPPNDVALGQAALAAFTQPRRP